jgi:AcrR family transcriptional regulator
MKTRQQILDATGRLLQTKGLARVTTRDIAAAASCAEGTLFKHFPRKEDLLLAAVQNGLPPLAGGPDADRLGRQTVVENLEETARAALEFYRRTLPLLAALFADPELFARYQAQSADSRGGSRDARQDLAAYLEGEQRAGRIRAEARPAAAAALLLGACFHHAFVSCCPSEASLPMDDDDFVRETVQSLVSGLEPRLAAP